MYGGYAVAGYTWSFSSSANQGAFVLKLDRNGKIPECSWMTDSTAGSYDIDISTASPDYPVIDSNIANSEALGYTTLVDAVAETMVCSSPPDVDADGVIDNEDNCIAVPNTDQADADKDGIGDVCDPSQEFEVDGTLDPSDSGAYYVCDDLYGCEAAVMNHYWYYDEWPTEPIAVKIYVAAEPPPGLPDLPGLLAQGTYFMHIDLDPEPPAYPYPPMGLSVNIPLLSPLPFSTVIELMHVDPNTEQIVPATQWALLCLNQLGCPKFSLQEDLSQWIPVYIPQPELPYPATCYVWSSSNTVPCPDSVQGESCGTFARCQNIATFSSIVGVVPNEVALTIDISPGSDINPINLKKKGVLPVAILGRSSVDAIEGENLDNGEDFDKGIGFDLIDMIDYSTLKFHGASPKHDLTDPETFADHREDVNGDGFMDLVIHFNTQEITGLNKSSIEGCLEGKTKSGQSLKGCDTIRCK